MNIIPGGWKTAPTLWAALGLGLLVAVFDLSTAFGDDTAQATLALLLAAGSLTGFLNPHQPWRWGLVIGPWLPLAHCVFFFLGWNHAINPNTLAANLLLLLIAIAVATLGSYAGALLRKALASAAVSQ
jgi:hypothetical protein